MAGGKARGKHMYPVRNRSRENLRDEPMPHNETSLAGKVSKEENTTDEAEKDSSGDQEKMEERRPTPRLVAICFLGIFVSYFIYGLLQEKITKRTFGGEHFHFFMFLVLFQCIVNSLVARLVSWYRNVEVSLKPHQLYTLLSFSYVAAMVASNSALAYISYPTQVLGKSAKPIPVLILGVLLSHKRYPAIKYLIVVLIVMGVAIFLYRDDKNAARHNDAQTPHSWRLFHFIGLGELLVFLSLTFDGLTGAMQERLRKQHNSSPYHMMFAVNVYSCLYLTFACVVTGEGLQSIHFIYRHPEVIANLILFAFCSAIGQLFIFTTITSLGPLTCSIFTTTRKFFTILGSVLLFGNPIMTRQWLGVVLVFLGLGLDILFGKAKNGGGGGERGGGGGGGGEGGGGGGRGKELNGSAIEKTSSTV